MGHFIGAAFRVLAEGQGAQAQVGYLQAGVAKVVVLHLVAGKRMIDTYINNKKNISYTKHFITLTLK